jgi:DMSO/TMAO reductase YedYZ molybdopterin-dependent catalytic subunit
MALQAGAAGTLAACTPSSAAREPAGPTLASGLAGDSTAGSKCTTISGTPSALRPDPQENWRDFSAVETLLAFRNHGMQAEFLREPITPLGAHYLLIHFDVPQLGAENYAVSIGGRVRNPMRVSLADIRSRRTFSQAVTMECAGTGRATMQPRGVYVPWFREAIGTYRWTGTPLRPLLQQAGLLDDAAEVLFTGWDSGIDLGVEHAFERSLPIAEAMRDEVMLAWEANGQPLLPQHGFPLRLVVPSWYGMASVKWLRAITVLNEPFRGVEQEQVYRYQRGKDEVGEAVRHKRVNSVITPPGIPDLLTRHRFVAPGRHVLQGVAWSGMGRVTAVEVSTDGGANWRWAEITPVSRDPYAWVQWRAAWDANMLGAHVLAARARDEAGNVQPMDPNAFWNRQSMGGNAVQRIPVTVQESVGASAMRVPSVPRMAVPGAKMPPPLRVANDLARL